MYHVGQSTRRRHRIRRVLVCLALALVIVGVIGGRQMLQSDTVIHQGQASTTQVSLAVPRSKTVTKPGFQLSLPETWEEVPTNTVYTAYSWHGTAKADGARQLTVYVDNLPTNLAVNRLLPVRAEGNGIIPTDIVSDNCINFTDKNTANPQTGAAPAKWSGISFLCDTANSLREVAGTSSADGINAVTVKGASGNSHTFFLTYNDQSAQSDFGGFTTILASFRAL